MTCGSCMVGDHNHCATRNLTIVGRYGGFADKVRCQSNFALPIPDELDGATAGPLLCGGITVFNPFLQCEIQVVHRVGVIGIGGLDHLALQFARAWGCEVTAFTSTDSKAEEALQLGAHRVVASRDSDALKAIQGQLDLIMCTMYPVLLRFVLISRCLTEFGVR